MRVIYDSLSDAPVQEVTIQADASQMGPGTALVQEGQPIGMLCESRFDDYRAKLCTDRKYVFSWNNKIYFTDV